MRRLVNPLSLCALVLFASQPQTLSAAEAGAVSGTVSNATTGNLLEGARVVIKELNLSAFADGTGRYVLTGVPAGVHELEVTYSGSIPPACK